MRQADAWVKSMEAEGAANADFWRWRHAYCDGRKAKGSNVTGVTMDQTKVVL